MAAGSVAAAASGGIATTAGSVAAAAIASAAVASTVRTASIASTGTPAAAIPGCHRTRCWSAAWRPTFQKRWFAARKQPPRALARPTVPPRCIATLTRLAALLNWLQLARALQPFMPSYVRISADQEARGDSRHRCSALVEFPSEAAAGAVVDAYPLSSGAPASGVHRAELVVGGRAATVSFSSSNPRGRGGWRFAPDWRCGHCRAVNFSKRAACFKCSVHCPSASLSVAAGSALTAHPLLPHTCCGGRCCPTAVASPAFASTAGATGR
jgi:hypothetical protein